MGGGRLERAHEGKMAELIATEETADAGEYWRLRSAESDARIGMNVAKLMLINHKQRHQLIRTQ
jgi:hypothetical protein